MRLQPRLTLLLKLQSWHCCGQVAAGLSTALLRSCNTPSSHQLLRHGSQVVTAATVTWHPYVGITAFQGLFLQALGLLVQQVLLNT